MMHLIAYIVDKSAHGRRVTIYNERDMGRAALLFVWWTYYYVVRFLSVETFPLSGE